MSEISSKIWEVLAAPYKDEELNKKRQRVGKIMAIYMSLFLTIGLLLGFTDTYRSFFLNYYVKYGFFSLPVMVAYFGIFEKIAPSPFAPASIYFIAYGRKAQIYGIIWLIYGLLFLSLFQ